MFSIKLEEKEKILSPDIEKSVFSSSSYLCRKCFNSFTTLCDKNMMAFLGNIEKTLVKISISVTDKSRSSPVTQLQVGTKRLQ